MLKYIIKRLLLFLPVFLVVSMIAFGLSKMTPGDPAELRMGDKGASSTADLEAQRRNYRQNAVLLGLDKPVFYFAFTTAAYPDTLYRIMPQNRRIALKKLCAQYGNWETIENYYHQLLQMEQAVASVPYELTKTDDFILIRNTIQNLFIAYKDIKIDNSLNNVEEVLGKKSVQSDSTIGLDDLLIENFNILQNSYLQIKETATPNQNYFPKFHWYGLVNQYHRWISNFLKGDFGISLRDYRPVADKIKDGLFWTLVINLSAIFIAYLLSIPLGVWSAVKKGSKTDRRISLVLFLLYSLPTFWIATLLIVFFTTPEYGMDFFPSTGLGNSSVENTSLWAVFLERLAHLILPVFCVTYAALAFITRQMRGSMVEVLEQDYVRTARAKGLNERTIIWKHAFRNALFPLITLFGSLLPSLIAGSVILEIIFNIPGMGRLVFDSINTQDWPVVYTVLMIGAVLTMIGILLSDFLYAAVDPRVRLK